MTRVAFTSIEDCRKACDELASAEITAIGGENMADFMI